MEDDIIIRLDKVIAKNLAGIITGSTSSWESNDVMLEAVDEIKSLREEFNAMQSYIYYLLDSNSLWSVDGEYCMPDGCIFLKPESM